MPVSEIATYRIVPTTAHNVHLINSDIYERERFSVISDCFDSRFGDWQFCNRLKNRVDRIHAKLCRDAEVDETSDEADAIHFNLYYPLYLIANRFPGRGIESIKKKHTQFQNYLNSYQWAQ